MTTVQQVFTGDASQLQREYEKLARSVTTLEGKLGQATTKSEQLAKKEKEGMNGMQAAAKSAAGQLQQMALSYFSVEAAIAAVNTQLEIENRLQTAALDKQMSVAGAQAGLALNTLDEKEFKRAVAEIDVIAKDTQFAGQDKLTSAAAEAISAAGGDIDLALKGLRTAAGLTRITPEALRPMTGATIDAARASGASTDEAAALVLSAGKTGRVVDPRQQADVLGKGIGGIVASSRGDRKQAAEQAAELIAALTTAMGDKMGDRSTTAAMSLSAQLDKFFTEGYKVRLGNREFTRKPDQDPGMVLDRMEKLQGDQKLMESFLKNAHFEAGAESIIKRMIREPQGKEATTLADARKTVGYDTRVLDQVKASMDRGTPQLEIVNEDIRRNAREESRQMADPRAMFAEAKKIRDEELFGYQKYSVRDSWAQTAENKLQDLFGYDPIQATRREAEQRLEGVYKAPSWLGTSKKKTDEELTPQERRDRDSLKEMIEQLKRIDQRYQETIRAGNQKADQQTQAIREQTEVIKQGQQQTKPATLIPSNAARGMIGAGRER
jgi:hypothetical protein